MDNMFDIRLIREFEKCRAFYDRTDPYFKNKAYTNQVWDAIAVKLGYKVELLKDRMVQLRNRFNLEKRKMETMKQEGQPMPMCTWPLYEYMTFLEAHIRPRKSYKMMMRERDFMHMKRQADESMTGFGDNDDSKVQMSAYGGSDSDDDVRVVYDEPPGIMKQEFNENPLDSGNASNGGFDMDMDGAAGVALSTSVGGPLPRQPPMKRHQKYPVGGASGGDPAEMPTAVAGMPAVFNPANMMDMNATLRKSDKFYKFGQFIASSLADMPEEQALGLLERFTSEIVAAMRSNITASLQQHQQQQQQQQQQQLNVNGGGPMGPNESR